MTEPIDPRLAEMLDAFTVPALPLQFADRIVARALAEPVTDVRTVGIAKFGQMRPRHGRWIRVVAAGSGLLAAGLLSVSAAAMGYLGEPLRQAVTQVVHHVPVVEQMLDHIIPHHRIHRSHIENGHAINGGLAGGQNIERPEVDSGLTSPPAIGGASLRVLPALAPPLHGTRGIHLHNPLRPEHVGEQSRRVPVVKRHSLVGESAASEHHAASSLRLQPNLPPTTPSTPSATAPLLPARVTSAEPPKGAASIGIAQRELTPAERAARRQERQHWLMQHPKQREQWLAQHPVWSRWWSEHGAGARQGNTGMPIEERNANDVRHSAGNSIEGFASRAEQDHPDGHGAVLGRDRKKVGRLGVARRGMARGQPHRPALRRRGRIR